jgi:hypothetical protein
MNRPFFMKTSSRQSHHRCIKSPARYELRRGDGNISPDANLSRLPDRLPQQGVDEVRAYQPAKLS